MSPLTPEELKRFEALKAIGFSKLDAPGKKEYSSLLARLDPAQLPPQPVEPCGLTADEIKQLEDLNSRIYKLSNEEKRIRVGLRRKKSDFKVEQMKKTLKKEEIVLGDPMSELAWIVSVMARCSAPILFKYISAAGVAESELKLMHRKIDLLNEFLNG